MIPLVNMLLGEMIFGGLGGGLYSILMVALVGLFIAGLMVGCTPEYLGKQLGPSEVKLITLYTNATPFAVLLLSALALRTSGNPRPSPRPGSRASDDEALNMPLTNEKAGTG